PLSRRERGPGGEDPRERGDMGEVTPPPSYYHRLRSHQVKPSGTARQRCAQSPTHPSTPRCPRTDTAPARRAPAPGARSRRARPRGSAAACSAARAAPPCGARLPRGPSSLPRAAATPAPRRAPPAVREARPPPSGSLRPTDGSGRTHEPAPPSPAVSASPPAYILLPLPSVHDTLSGIVSPS